VAGDSPRFARVLMSEPSGRVLRPAARAPDSFREEMMTSIAVKPVGIAWLRSRPFDLGFILGIAAVAVAAGLATVVNPTLFPVLLFLDLWLLGYHHVISTFTRILFDRDSFSQYWFLVTVLPAIVIVAVVAMAWGLGVWSVVSLYLYWQWFHYARQSYGVAQAYRRKSNGLVTEDPITFQVIFYLVPLWGILHRSAQDPARFLGLELRVIPVPGVVADAVGAIALAALALWIGRKAFEAWRGRLAVAHTMFMASHFGIFVTGYVLIDGINEGWLVLNIWHNLQYIAFVWLYNNNRFRSGIDPRHKLLSTLSQSRNVIFYLAVSLALSTGLYVLVREAIITVASASFVYVVLAYQVFNFHHYVVDAVIWRSRRKAAAAA